MQDCATGSNISPLFGLFWPPKGKVYATDAGVYYRLYRTHYETDHELDIKSSFLLDGTRRGVGLVNKLESNYLRGSDSSIQGF